MLLKIETVKKMPQAYTVTVVRLFIQNMSGHENPYCAPFTLELAEVLRNSTVYYMEMKKIASMHNYIQTGLGLSLKLTSSGVGSITLVRSIAKVIRTAWGYACF